MKSAFRYPDSVPYLKQEIAILPEQRSTIKFGALGALSPTLESNGPQLHAAFLSEYLLNSASLLSNTTCAMEAPLPQQPRDLQMLLDSTTPIISDH